MFTIPGTGGRRNGSTDRPLRDPDTGESPLQQRYYAFAAHTGMITYPMALFARVVLQEGKPRYRGSAQQYLAWTQKSVEFHDAEWQQRELPDGSTGGDYVWPKGAPVPFDGLIQPFNQTHALGQTMAELHRTGRVPDVGEKVTAMISSFRADVEVDGDAWQWRYWPTYSELLRGYSADEQISEIRPGIRRPRSTKTSATRASRSNFWSQLITRDWAAPRMTSRISSAPTRTMWLWVPTASPPG